MGIVFVALALLLLVALFSYDRHDLATNYLPADNPMVTQNWIGRFGAGLADKLFFAFGASAYLLPVFMLGFGLASFVSGMAYLRRRWPWALVLALTCAAALDLGMDRAAYDRLVRHGLTPDTGFLEQLTLNLNAPSAGGVLGESLNRYLFRLFGTAGSAILFTAFYLISLYGLTNFHLGDWIREMMARRAAEDALAAGDERALERRSRQLEKESRKLQSELEKASRKAGTSGEVPEPNAEMAGDEERRSGLGPDLQPIPEPTVRDLSVPQARLPVAGPEIAKPAPVPREPEPPDDGLQGVSEIIPAKEVAAATSDEILGADNPFARKSGSPSPADADPDSGSREAASTEPDPSAVSVPAAASSIRPKPPAARRPKAMSVSTPPQIGNYQLPALDLLALPDLTVKPTESKEELMANARLMVQTLAQFGIEVSPGDITKGPTITRYELHPSPGVKLEKISALSNNIAAALKAERINILAPIPGKSSVGVEVPNAIKSKVIMRELLESDEWRHSKCRIPLALGKDVYGHPIVADLAEMPHLLIAGSTGSGKSVCINSIVASLLYRFPPDQLRFVMIDPKVVELQQYNALPHLVVPVVTDPKKVILALRWVVSEMEKRYQIFARVGVRNIKAFNERPKDKPLPTLQPELPLTARKEKVEAGADGFAVEVDEEIVVPRDDEVLIPDKLSYIVVIIDELADLMLVAPADVEMAIARITQMARAAGIHCIVATQRPSVDVITGVIKANIPSRIAFQVASKVDSRTILDAMGADKLLGKGDMLYLPPGSARLIRAQGALVTDQEIQSVVDFIALQGKPSYELEIHQQLSKSGGRFDVEDGASDEDEDLIQQCIEVIRSEQKASVSLLQRRLRLGYTRAARIMDELEQRGIVGPSKGAEPRDILIDLDGGGADGGAPE
ncbi:MAG: DNA translocase FtsK [Limisphaerales bacterium]